MLKISFEVILPNQPIKSVCMHTFVLHDIVLILFSVWRFECICIIISNTFVGFLCRITTCECVKPNSTVVFSEIEIVFDEKEKEREEEVNSRSHTNSRIAAIIPNTVTYVSLCVYMYVSTNILTH